MISKPGTSSQSHDSGMESGPLQKNEGFLSSQVSHVGAQTVSLSGEVVNDSDGICVVARATYRSLSKQLLEAIEEAGIVETIRPI